MAEKNLSQFRHNVRKGRLV